MVPLTGLLVLTALLAAALGGIHLFCAKLYFLDVEAVVTVSATVIGFLFAFLAGGIVLEVTKRSFPRSAKPAFSPSCVAVRRRIWRTAQPFVDADKLVLIDETGATTR